MWRQDHFRNPAHRQRALELRNHGITVSPHASWGEAAKARRQANIEAIKAVICPFDRYLLDATAAVSDMMHDFASQYRMAVIRYEEGLDDGQAIPF